MTGMQKNFMYSGFVVIALCVLSAADSPAPSAAPPEPTEQTEPAPVDERVLQMRELIKEEKFQELLDQYQDEDFTKWPLSTGEAFYQRGLAYRYLNEWTKAERDLEMSVKFDPHEGFFWYNLAATYRQLKRDNAKTAEAYKNASEREDRTGWMPADAALKAVDLYLNQPDPDAALEVLESYSEEDLKNVSTVWRIRILRAYGRVYAAQGREAEAWEKFREALRVERGQ